MYTFCIQFQHSILLFPKFDDIILTICTLGKISTFQVNIQIKNETYKDLIIKPTNDLKAETNILQHDFPFIMCLEIKLASTQNGTK